MIHGIDTSFLVAVEVVGYADHEAARALRDRALDAGEGLALAPQVLAEFIHVVTDQRARLSCLRVLLGARAMNRTATLGFSPESDGG